MCSDTPAQASCSRPPVILGGRYFNAKTKHPLTVRYIGPLPPGSNDSQIWLGVEYDDPSHGKGHAGTFRETQVFHTVHPRAGAFIKVVPGTSPVIEGPTLVAALEERYGVLVIGRAEKDAVDQAEVVLGSSNAAIVVEAPGMADVRRRIGRLERLREIGFDGEGVTRLGGDEEERSAFKERLKGVHTLDLSKNLVSSWAEMAELVDHLPGLTTLVMNHSRIAALPKDMPACEAIQKAFGKVTELHLGDAAVTWAEAMAIGSLFPKLETFHLNHNSRITDLKLTAGDVAAKALRSLKTLSLDKCSLETWCDLVTGLVGLPMLEALSVSGIPMVSIPERTPNTPRFSKLVRITMSDARISPWSDIDNLNDWTSGKLHTLRISCVFDGEGEVKPHKDPLCMSGDPHLDRPLLIAKLPSLTMLNATPVTAAERWDAELYYVRYVHNLTGLPELPGREWGRYEDLVRQHGPAIKEPAPKGSTLKSKMMNLTIIPPSGFSFTLRMLPAAPTLLLQKRVARQLKLPSVTLHTARQHDVMDGFWEPVEEMDNSQELGMWVGDGDTVLVGV